MSLIGLDFGSHASSIAIWSEEKNTIEVIADDLGFRSIPTTIAYRGDEIITGQSAVSQQHKNANNTFADVRSMLLNPDKSVVRVPLLDKDVSVVELGSHFFRNIHNQIKQQLGKVVRECVVAVPQALDAATKDRLTESAQAGGIRIKSFVDDCTAALLALQLDDASLPPSKTLVVDIGWSKSVIALYDVSGGLFNPIASATIAEACGDVFVNLLAAHCAKDFMRKAKFPCTDNKKSMVRLRRECETAMKSLSLSTEATVDIDSLCEGVDFSLKISRARFEDLLTIPFMQLKNQINAMLEQAGISAAQVQRVCLSGGPSNIPRIINTMKSLFSTAQFPRGRFDASEVHCIGAAQHAVHLFELGLIDSAPTCNPVATCTNRAILLGSSDSAVPPTTVIPAKAVLPVTVELAATLSDPQQAGFLQLFVGGENPAADAPVQVGEVAFKLDTAAATDGADTKAVVVSVSVAVDGTLSVEIKQSASDIIVGSLTVPTAASN